MSSHYFAPVKIFFDTNENTMIKDASNTDLQLYAVELLREEISKPGVNRVDVAKRLQCSPAAMTHWLSLPPRSLPNQEHTLRIIEVLGEGMDAKLISDFVKAYGSDSDSVRKLINIRKSNNPDIIKLLNQYLTTLEILLKE